ncbi:MAG: hypothetical protein KAX50_02365 [Saprospiraceae bacterium]|nr:hypothetical protein [Saprospiraceae bacterium]
MNTTPYQPPPLKILTLLLLVIFLVSSCKFFSKAPQETVFLEPDLLQLAQEVKAMERTRGFYTRLDSLAMLPEIKGGVLASDLKSFRSELREIERIKTDLTSVEDIMRRRFCPACGSVLPPKPPPPPPPIIEGDRFRINVPLKRSTVVFLRPETSSISIVQGNTIVQPTSISKLEDGYQRAVFDVSPFKEGQAIMQIGGKEGVPANIPMNMTLK